MWIGLISSSARILARKLLANNIIHQFQEFPGGICRDGRACRDVVASAHAAYGARTARQCIRQVQPRSDQIVSSPGRYFEITFLSSG